MEQTVAERTVRVWLWGFTMYSSAMQCAGLVKSEQISAKHECLECEVVVESQQRGWWDVAQTKMSQSCSFLHQEETVLCDIKN